MAALSAKRILAGIVVALNSAPALAVTPFPWNGFDLNGRPCSIAQTEHSYGPYDYTNPIHQRDKLPIVEEFHFTAPVENLIRGQSGALLPDLFYTIRAFPNHHRALYALVRYQLNVGQKLNIPPECWLDRALAFKPSDEKVYLIYGIYLHRLGKHDLALHRYKQAEKLAPNYSEVYYNMGLLYLDKGDIDHAVEYAKKAYALNYPLPGLRHRLKERGYLVAK